MQRINNKALSTVVSTMFLIVLSLIAVGVLWNVVSKLTSPEVLLSPSQCLNFQINKPIIIQKACYNELTNDLEITLQRKTQEKISSLDFIVQESSESTNWCCGTECPDCTILESGTKKYFLSFEEKPKSVNLILENDCIIEEQVVVGC